MCWRPTRRGIYKHLKQLNLHYLVQARQATLAQTLVRRNYAMTSPRPTLVLLCCLVRVNRLNHPAAISQIIVKVRIRKIKGKVGWWRYTLPRLGGSHHMLHQVTSHPTSRNLYPLNSHLPRWATRLRRETRMRKVGVDILPRIAPLIFNVFTDEESRNILRSPVKTDEAEDFLGSFLPTVKKEEETCIKPEGIH